MTINDINPCAKSEIKNITLQEYLSKHKHYIIAAL